MPFIVEACPLSAHQSACQARPVGNPTALYQASHMMGLDWGGQRRHQTMSFVPPTVCAVKDHAGRTSKTMSCQGVCHACWHGTEKSLLLQNPVNTIAWLMVQLHLLSPLVVLVRDCAVFTMPPSRFKPLAFLLVLWSLSVTVLTIAGPPIHANTFHLYVFPFSFRWRFQLFAMGAIIPYYVLLRLVRRLLFKHERRRISSDP